MHSLIYFLPFIHNLSIVEQKEKIIFKQRGRWAGLLVIPFVISLIYDLLNQRYDFFYQWVISLIITIVLGWMLLSFKMTIDKHFRTLTVRWLFLKSKYPLNGPFFVRIRDHTTKRPYVEWCYEHKTVIRLDQKTVACQRVLDYMKEIGVKIEYGLHWF